MGHVSPGLAHLGLLQSSEHSHKSQTHPGLPQCHSQQSLQKGQNNSDRVVSSSSNIHSNLQSLAQTIGGHVCYQTESQGPWWQSGNTLASHLCGRGSIPVMAVSGKAGSCLPLVGSLQYRTLANYMYWFPLPFQLPVVI